MFGCVIVFEKNGKVTVLHNFHPVTLTLGKCHKTKYAKVGHGMNYYYAKFGGFRIIVLLLLVKMTLLLFFITFSRPL